MAFLQSSSNDSWLNSITSKLRRGCIYLGLCACLGFVLLSLTWWSDRDRPLDKSFSPSTSPSAKPVGFPPLPAADDDEHVSLCVAVKDQSRDLDEFLVHYYYHHGIRRFYIMDDGSDPPLSYTRNFGRPPFAVPRSAITFRYIERVPDRPQPFQHVIYSDYCIKNFGNRHTWMGFLDADEFLEMRRELTLVDWLHQWEDVDLVGALSVNWITHNSGGWQKRPQSDTRKGFRRCVVDQPDERNAAGENAHVKSFVKTALFDGVHSVHFMSTANGTVSVGEKGDECDIKRYPITHDTWALHHYSVKSHEQFLEKQQRGSPNNHHAAGEFWDRIEGADDYECPELAAYVP